MRAIKDALPDDALWSLACGRDPEDCYFLNVYANIEDVWQIRELAQREIVELRREGVALVLLIDDREAAQYSNQRLLDLESL